MILRRSQVNLAMLSGWMARQDARGTPSWGCISCMVRWFVHCNLQWCRQFLSVLYGKVRVQEKYGKSSIIHNGEHQKRLYFIMFFVFNTSTKKSEKYLKGPLGHFFVLIDLLCFIDFCPNLKLIFF